MTASDPGADVERPQLAPVMVIGRGGHPEVYELGVIANWRMSS